MSYQYYQNGQYAGSRAFDSGQRAQQAQQTQQAYHSHPMVVIPSQQPRHDVSHLQTSPYTPYSQPQPHFHSTPVFYQAPSQYSTVPEESYYVQSQSQPQPQFQSQPRQDYHYGARPVQRSARHLETVHRVQKAVTTQRPVQPSPSPLEGHPYTQRPVQQSAGHLRDPSYAYQANNYAQPLQLLPSQAQPQQPYQAPYQNLPRQQFQSSPPLPLNVRSSPDPLQGPANVTRTRPPVSQSYLQAHGQTSRPQQRSSQQVGASSYSMPAQNQPLQPRQRVVTAVEIPSYSYHQPTDHDMARSPKRRRSNDGHAIPMCDAKPPAKRPPQRKPSIVASSPLTELNPSQFPPTPQPSIDYHTVLLSLAEEYINAAYSMSNSTATSDAPNMQHEEYCSLISTAMACLESVLNNYRQTDPRKEARIRLRLATLLIEECDNDEEADAILGKGIALCDRSRLTDLKYAMQHLSARSAFRRSPKAALKSVDKLVEEVETLRLQHWVYAFRFLRVSLGLQLGTYSELAAVAKQLTALNATADHERHVAVQIVAAALEMIVHLRSHAPDAADMASRAMATAQTHQLSPELQAMPQVRGLLDSLDVACSLLSFNAEQAWAKVQRMHQYQDGHTRELGWSKDGSFGVELGPSNNEHLEQDTGGIMRRSNNGNAMLVVQWLTKNQLYALGYGLSGITMMLKTMGKPLGGKDRKADEFLLDGLKMASLKPESHHSPLHSTSTLLDQQQELSLVMRVFLIFAQVGRFEWDTARCEIEALRKDGKVYSGSEQWNVLLYLEALCLHGLGELRSALELYNSTYLTFDSDSKATAADKDLRALATLNSILIRRSLGAPEYANAERLLAKVEPYCLGHPNKALYSAVNLVKATAQDTILKTKQFLHFAVHASKEAQNNLLMCILMNIMTSRFFAQAIVGEQAENGAHAARTLAKQGKNTLWVCVADQMYADIKERCGKSAEAEVARREGVALLEDLPESLKKSLQSHNGLAPSNGGMGVAP